LFQENGEFNYEFNNAWNQVEGYVSFVLKNKEYLRGKRLDFENPEYYLVIGYELYEKQLKKIREKVMVTSAIKVLTYNDLIAKAEETIKRVKEFRVGNKRYMR
jgi:hypothetical protein